MIETYPIVLSKEGKFYVVYIPDFDSATQGDDINDAIEMGKDAICLLGVCLEDEGKEIPKPNTREFIKEVDDVVVFVDVDFTKYRLELNE